MTKPKRRAGVALQVRMTEDQRAQIEAAAATSGSSMNAEIVHRLENYDRLLAGYGLLSINREAQLYSRAFAEIAARITENVVEARSDKLPDQPSEYSEEERIAKMCRAAFAAFSSLRATWDHRSTGDSNTKPIVELAMKRQFDGKVISQNNINFIWGIALDQFERSLSNLETHEMCMARAAKFRELAGTGKEPDRPAIYERAGPENGAELVFTIMADEFEREALQLTDEPEPEGRQFPEDYEKTPAKKG